MKRLIFMLATIMMFAATLWAQTPAPAPGATAPTRAETRTTKHHAHHHRRRTAQHHSHHRHAA